MRHTHMQDVSGSTISLLYHDSTKWLSSNKFSLDM